jgi:hypothetical protein
MNGCALTSGSDRTEQGNGSSILHVNTRRLFSIFWRENWPGTAARYFLPSLISLHHKQMALSSLQISLAEAMLFVFCPFSILLSFSDFRIGHRKFWFYIFISHLTHIFKNYRSKKLKLAEIILRHYVLPKLYQQKWYWQLFLSLTLKRETGNVTVNTEVSLLIKVIPSGQRIGIWERNDVYLNIREVIVGT